MKVRIIYMYTWIIPDLGVLAGVPSPLLRDVEPGQS